MQLIWCDVEVSDRPLELAVTFADLARPFEVTEQKRWVFAGPGEGKGRYADNGLLFECGKSVTVPPDAEAWLCKRVRLDAPEDAPILAGSDVHLTLDFFNTVMPKFAKRVSPRLYDVAAVKLFCNSVGMPSLPEAQTHRALADITESIEHAKACAEWLAPSNSRYARDYQRLSHFADAVKQAVTVPRPATRSRYTAEGAVLGVRQAIEQLTKGGPLLK